MSSRAQALLISAPRTPPVGLNERRDGVDAIVLGAGISGLVAASVLLEQGAERVIVLEEYPAVGGNHLDAHIGAYTFDVGSLIFQDDSPLVARFPELLSEYVPIDPSWSRVTPQGVVCEYPFSIDEDILRAGPVEWIRIAASLALSRVRYRFQRNARDFAYYWMGRRLAERSGLEHYIERFCGVSADQVDLDFARSRMMWIAEHARIATQLRRLRNRKKGSSGPRRRNTQLVRPRAGFGALYAPVVRHLEAAGAQFVLGARITRIERTEHDLVVHADGRRYRAERVVSTIPVTTALRLAGQPCDPLPAVTLITLYYSFAGVRGFTDSILYNFSHLGGWKRLTMHSDFYGPADGREFFAVEVPAGASITEAEAAAVDFRRHTAANGLFAGDLVLEGSHILANTYPIFTHGSREQADAAIVRLRELGILSLGKQGGFEYQPTARVSTVHAERALQAKAEVTR